MQATIHGVAKSRAQLSDFTFTFPGGLAIENSPCNTGDAGSIPDHGMKIPHAEEQLNPTCCSY